MLVEPPSSQLPSMYEIAHQLCFPVVWFVYDESPVSLAHVEKKVHVVIKNTFAAAALVQPEMSDPLCRAIYGVDIMLDSLMQPTLLEVSLGKTPPFCVYFLFTLLVVEGSLAYQVTYCPDLTRAISHDFSMTSAEHKGEVLKGSDFVNSVFGCLFLNERQGVCPL